MLLKIASGAPRWMRPRGSEQGVGIHRMPPPRIEACGERSVPCSLRRNITTSV